MLDDVEVVAQPLHQRAGDGDAALERIMRWLLAELVRHSGQQSELRLHRLCVGIQQQEAAGAVGVLRLSGLEAGLPHQRGLLIAQVSGQRNARQRAGGNVSVHLAAGGDARQHRRRNAERPRVSPRPTARVSRFIN